MSDLCAPLVVCGDLDSSVLFQRSVYGPTLVSDTSSLPFGALALRGAAVRPYVDLHFELRWVPQDLCLGPISSVMTLAPGETVTVATRSEHRTSFTDLVRDATDRSSVSTHTRQGPDNSVGKLVGGQMGAANEQDRLKSSLDQKQKAMQDMVELRSMYAKGYGSFFSDLGDVVAAVATGGASLVGKGIAGAVSDVVNHGVGSSGQPGAAVIATVAAITEITDSISRNERQTHLSESTHSTQDSTSTSVTRTFSNPYRDRTLQLRFMPVFRRFDGVVSIVRARVGLAMVCGHLDFTTTNVGARHVHVLANVIAEPNLMRLAHAEIGAAAADFHAGTGLLQDHLQANAAVYTKRFLSATIQARDEEALHGAFSELLNRNTSTTTGSSGDIAAGLAWSQSEVRANVIHVPLADTDSLQSAWRLDTQTSAALNQAVSQLSPGALGTILGPPPTQTLHLYAGSHMEAVPGECILPDIITDALGVPVEDND